MCTEKRWPQGRVLRQATGVEPVLQGGRHNATEGLRSRASPCAFDRGAATCITEGTGERWRRHGGFEPALWQGWDRLGARSG